MDHIPNPAHNYKYELQKNFPKKNPFIVVRCKQDVEKILLSNISPLYFSKTVYRKCSKLCEKKL